MDYGLPERGFPADEDSRVRQLGKAFLRRGVLSFTTTGQICMDRQAMVRIVAACVSEGSLASGCSITSYPESIFILVEPRTLVR